MCHTDSEFGLRSAQGLTVKWSIFIYSGSWSSQHSVNKRTVLNDHFYPFDCKSPCEPAAHISYQVLQIKSGHLQYAVLIPRMHVFDDCWRNPGGNPRRHRENMQTSHIKFLPTHELKLGPSCTVLTITTMTNQPDSSRHKDLQKKVM